MLSVMRAIPRTARLVAPATLAILVLALGSHARADIYRWVDGEGVIHFTSKKEDPAAKLFLRGNRSNRGVAFAPAAIGDPDRFSKFDLWIRQAAAAYQLPEALLRAVIKVESNYEPRATSPAGARGLMQLMPDTATAMQVRSIDDPRENIFGGARFLRILANAFAGDLRKTIAGYNAGEGAVRRYGGIPPFPETQAYVERVGMFYRRYRSIPDVTEASREP
jgi:soluble lytic murein transglycosylase-like protein